MSKVVSTIMWKAMGIVFKKTNKTINNMKTYVYSGEIPTPDYKYKEESIYSLIELIKFLPDSDIIAFSVQDLKNLIGIEPESSRDFSLK